MMICKLNTEKSFNVMWYFVEHKGRAKASAKAMRAALRRRDELILKGLPPLELKVTDSDGNEY